MTSHLKRQPSSKNIFNLQTYLCTTEIGAVWKIPSILVFTYLAFHFTLSQETHFQHARTHEDFSYSRGNLKLNPSKWRHLNTWSELCCGRIFIWAFKFNLYLLDFT
jgi:hypothetical protein